MTQFHPDTAELLRDTDSVLGLKHLALEDQADASLRDQLALLSPDQLCELYDRLKAQGESAHDKRSAPDMLIASLGWQGFVLNLRKLTEIAKQQHEEAA